MMKASNTIKTYLLLLGTVFFLLSFNASAGWWWSQGAQCDDIVDREQGGYINVLTFNTLFYSEAASVEGRLVPIVDFLEAQEIPVDVILLQEVVGGTLILSDPAKNSANLLKDMLADRGLDYNLKTAFEIGIPGVFYTGNAILSRCEIRFSLVKRLPREFEVNISGQDVKLPRNVQMARLKIPGFGKLNTYNTHLCSGCNPNERGNQLTELFKFMNTVERFIPGRDPIILAGDFNIDRFKNQGEEDFLYQQIIGKGFADAYAESVTEDLNDLCEDSENPDEHCTFGVSAFHFADSGEASRIDYIFSKGFGASSDGEVFFNPVVINSETDAYVSDHSAVLVRIPLSSQ